MIHSYPKVYGLGHAAITELFQDPVIIEEKIDGSQFSFSLTENSLECRSKGQEQRVDSPDKMFERATATVKALSPLLQPGWVYRTEYLAKPHHNTLAYDRVPQKHLIIFDIDTGNQAYMGPTEKHTEAERLGMECAPILAEGRFDSFEAFAKLLETPSCLGGQTVEGLVIKNYHRFGRDGKALMGKYVSERFKEVHRDDWKDRHPGGQEIRQQLGQSLRTTARWQKAIQHLREAGQLQNDPRDIGPLIKEIQQDVREECADEIKQQLFKWAWGDISRIIIRGFPEWYKEQLARQQFGEEAP